jgi:hypothetical protein
MVGECLAVVVDETKLDIRTADIDADEVGLFRLNHSDSTNATGEVKNGTHAV